MKNNLGKICILTILFITGLFADVKLTINTPAIYEGELASFTITSDIDDTSFPQINTIGNYNILNRASTTSRTYINGNYSKKVSYTYSFAPKKDVIIPPFKIKADGKTYETKAAKVSVIKANASKDGEDFVLEIKADKKEVKVGESINLDVIFKYKIDSKIDKLQMNEPKLENFWIKKVGEADKSSENDYIVFTQKYILFPQKAGVYDLNSIEADIGKQIKRRISNDFMNDSFFNDPFFDAVTNRISWQKVNSNSLNLMVNPLPNKLELIGDYTLEKSVDKNEVEANQPVNLSINIKGVGNIDDIQKYTLHIDNVITYADEPKINSSFEGNEYKGTFSQKIALVAQSNYTIPKITLTYFDKDDKMIKTISSKDINIKVNNSNQNSSKVKIETSNNIPKVLNNTKVQKVEKDETTKYIILTIGILLMALALFIFFTKKKTNKKVEKDIIRLIRRAKNDKELFELLLPYSKKNKIVEDIQNQLEENLYKNAKNKIDKKALIAFFEDEEAE